MPSNIEGGKVIKGFAKALVGAGELYGANAINPVLVGGTVNGVLETLVNAVTFHGPQAVDSAKSVYTNFLPAFENGPGHVAGGVVVVAAVVDGGRRLITGGADVKEGFGK